MSMAGRPAPTAGTPRCRCLFSKGRCALSPWALPLTAGLLKPMPRHATSWIRSATTPRRCQSSSTGWAAKSPSSRAQVATSLFSRVDGKLFVDAGVTATRPRILAAVLGRETPHWRFDHTDGNKWLNRGGAAAARAVRDWQPDEGVLLYPQYSTTTTGLLAHENTHEHLLSPQSAEDWEFNFPSPPLSAVPTEGGGEGEGGERSYGRGAHLRGAVPGKIGTRRLGTTDANGMPRTAPHAASIDNQTLQWRRHMPRPTGRTGQPCCRDDTVVGPTRTAVVAEADHHGAGAT